MVFDFVVADSFVGCSVDEGAQLGRVDATQRRVIRVEEEVPDGEGYRNYR